MGMRRLFSWPLARLRADPADAAWRGCHRVNAFATLHMHAYACRKWRDGIANRRIGGIKIAISLLIIMPAVKYTRVK
ncbi:hypothetical protein ABIB38_001176 [Massilia sp. UYP11]|uniref:hypothetical protein n=1 Tax=Massilia sp. UYP11 TaxID=1756385 RepID=UPI003D205F8F